MLTVCEIYETIQGESTFAGVPCVMVRLAGCPFHCSWCDTQYAQDPENGVRMSVVEIVRKVAAFKQRVVEVTGGEPLSQSDTPELLGALRWQAGMKVLLETSGLIQADHISGYVHRVIDVKPPSSGQHLLNQQHIIRRKDQFKFVLATVSDIDWALEKAVGLLCRGARTILFSPAGDLEPAFVAEAIVDSKLPIRMNLQLHKYIWGKDVRGT